MTNEEAINRIVEHSIIHKLNEPNAVKISEALNMAITALRIQPSIDCISRVDALMKFTVNSKGERIPDRDIDNFPTQISIQEVKKILRELPSVCHIGKWINIDGTTNSGDCSCCGNRGRAWMNYCYICGARMVISNDTN